MFIRTVTVKGHSYIRLVESYRENGKVKQRYIATICSQETWDMNRPEDFVDMVIDYMVDLTDIGTESVGSRKQTKNAVKGMAQDLLEDFDKRLRDAKQKGE